MFQGVGHRDWYPSMECNAFWGMYNRPYNMLPTHIYENHWTEETPDAYFPRLRGYLATSTNGVLRMPNTRYLQNAAYIRLKNLTFGYNVPREFLERLKMSKLQIFFTGQNLITFTKYDGMDPEVGYGAGYSWTSGIDRGFYPSPKVFQAGISIRF